MLRDVLTLGDKIDIKRLDRNGEPAQNARTYVSQLVDFVDYDVIHIATPIMNSALIILNIGENYKLCFYTSKGLYRCNCVVLNNYKENNTVIAAVRITSNLEKYQRRQYYRLECILDIDYHVITKEEEKLNRKLKAEDFQNNEERNECRKRLAQLENEWLSGTIIDISGGGARFNSEVQHNKEDKIQIKLDLSVGNGKCQMIIGTEVVSSGRVINKISVYEHRVEFKEISKKDREELIKYIFEQERRRRKYDKN
ncbi:MAG: PilZ domain-containing protein [Herbinix sp.]|nr:PilZ domain-containing protein [Herbinix sp.]